MKESLPSSGALSRLYLSDVAAPQGLEQALLDLVRGGREAWPAIALAPEDFVRHLARHRPADADPVLYLSTVHVRDLFLACACGSGDAAALAEFDRTLLAQVPGFLGRLAASPAFVDDVKQTLREKLLVATPDASPRILEYSGTGTLYGWLRVAAMRVALNLRRSRDDRGGAPFEEEDVAAAVPVEKDAELSYLRERYKKEFQEAMRAAFLGLPKEQRHVLRLHFAGGQTGDQIAALLKVNRSTVVRWLASARTAMFHETRRHLRDRLRLTPAELDSLTAMVRSQLDMNLSALLGSGV